MQSPTLLRLWMTQAGLFRILAMTSTTLPRSGATAALPGLIVACLAATWLIWGSTYLAIKWALISFPPCFQMGTRWRSSASVQAWWWLSLQSCRRWWHWPSGPTACVHRARRRQA